MTAGGTCRADHPEPCYWALIVKRGAAVGAGVSREGKRVLSDVNDDVAGVAGWITPRLGGVGPMTRAMLLVNTMEAAERAAG